MRRITFLLFATFAVNLASAREDAGVAKNPAAYLNLIPSARSAAMGYAQGAVIPREATDMVNPATLGLLDAQYFSATSGSVGVGRQLLNAGYVFPFHWNENDHFFRAEQNPTGTPREEWNAGVMRTDATRYAIFLGGTSFGLGNIGGQSEFGDPTGSFDDKERNISLALAARPYENLSFGLNVRMLRQSLPSATASGMSLTFGTWYGAPALKWGTFDFGAGIRDTGGSLKWKVNDPDLGISYDYEEKIATKIWAGTAFHSASGRWLYSLDTVKPSREKVRLNAGIEARLSRAFYLRAGSNDFSPTVGCGVFLGRRALDVILDYAMQPDMNSLANAQWVTFSLRFLPVASDMDASPEDNSGHNRLDRNSPAKESPRVLKPKAAPARTTAEPAVSRPASSSPAAKDNAVAPPVRKSGRPTLNNVPRTRKKS